jgi:hypothetical protein
MRRKSRKRRGRKMKRRQGNKVVLCHLHALLLRKPLPHKTDFYLMTGLKKLRRNEIKLFFLENFRGKIRDQTRFLEHRVWSY